MDYVKLGPKAESFSDPITGFTLVGNQVKELPTKFKKSLKISRGLTGGHLSMASEKEFKEFEKFKSESKVTPVVEEDIPIGASKEKKYKAEIKNLLAEKNILLGEKADWEDEKQTLENRIEELEELVPAGDEPINFDGKSDDELIEYYNENFEVNKDLIKKFKAMPIEEKIAELKELEKEE